MSLGSQDIYARIANNLRDDKESLKACSLVASAWRPSSQRLLHQTMVFRSVLPLPGAKEDPTAKGPEKTRRLLDTSAHLLQYVCTIILRGDHVDAFWSCRVQTSCPRICPQDPSLAGFLGKLNTLELPSLSHIELHDLTWTKLKPDLQRELVSLLSGRYAENVALFNCVIHYGIQWTRFTGPATITLKFKGVTLVGDFSAEHETPIIDIPLSSAPNLIYLDTMKLHGNGMEKWILLSPKASGDPSVSSTPNTPSWRESVAVLALRCHANNGEGPPQFVELIRACPNLVDLTLTSQSAVPTFPFDEITRIATLESLTIEPISPGSISWLISSVKAINPRPSSASGRFASIVVNLKNVDIYTWVEVTTKDMRSAIPELLRQVRELDDAVMTRLPNVKFNLSIQVVARGMDREPTWALYNETMKTLGGLKDDMKALTLEDLALR
ncbi:hypothetical protein ONZ45_g11198 [Pleurotus djamor]|nr:hypothetical protein ONZ45_g11198 [Pleurotus djamor]